MPEISFLKSLVTFVDPSLLVLKCDRSKEVTTLSGLARRDIVKPAESVSNLEPNEAERHVRAALSLVGQSGHSRIQVFIVNIEWHLGIKCLLS
jgi:hypothetical protein